MTSPHSYVSLSYVPSYGWRSVWLSRGLRLSFTADSNLLDYLFEHQGLFWGLCIGELALVWILSRNIMKFSIPVATGAFVFYSVLSGVTLSPIFTSTRVSPIASTFFITAATFGAMAAFGYFTKRDLSKVGSYLYMALIGLIIATLVNLFLKSDTLMWIISYVGVLIFVASQPTTRR